MAKSIFILFAIVFIRARPAALLRTPPLLRTPSHPLRGWDGVRSRGWNGEGGARSWEN
jgi:hypothetical protein